MYKKVKGSANKMNLQTLQISAPILAEMTNNRYKISLEIETKFSPSYELFEKKLHELTIFRRFPKRFLR